jgi:hypothetical protein
MVEQLLEETRLFSDEVEIFLHEQIMSFQSVDE